jgi:hypothetical protein
VPVDVEHELDRLYGVELAEFVRERTRLAGLLRTEGRRAEADQVKALRKPSVAVWTVNQLARRRRKEIGLLLDAGQRLATAQRALLAGGDRQAFERAGEAEREALKRLSAAARSILAERGSTAMLERATSTLRAAAVSDAARSDLARGRLTDDLDPSGFDAFNSGPTGAVAAPKGKPRGRAHGQAKRKPTEQQKTAIRAAIDEARAELKSARERETMLARKLRDAERAERRTRAGHEHAERALARARDEHETAVGAVQAARAKLQQAQR